MTSILTVCTGNVCRSPVAEAALRTALHDSGIQVVSAGTLAGRDASAAPESMAYIRRAYGDYTAHRARRLDRATTAGSDLILTMTRDQRTWVATEDPRAIRRTFTLLELAAIVPDLPPTAQHSDLRDFANACTRLRSPRLGAPEELDIVDPYGGPAAGYAEAFALIDQASMVIARAISSSIAAEPPRSSVRPGREPEGNAR